MRRWPSGQGTGFSPRRSRVRVPHAVPAPDTLSEQFGSPDTGVCCHRSGLLTSSVCDPQAMPYNQPRLTQDGQMAMRSRIWALGGPGGLLGRAGAGRTVLARARARTTVFGVSGRRQDSFGVSGVQNDRFERSNAVLSPGTRLVLWPPVPLGRPVAFSGDLGGCTPSLLPLYHTVNPGVNS